MCCFAKFAASQKVEASPLAESHIFGRRPHIPPSGGTFREAAYYLTTIFCVFTFSPTILRTYTPVLSDEMLMRALPFTS